MKIGMGTIRWLKSSAIGGALLLVVGVALLSVPLVSDVLIDHLQIFPPLTLLEIDTAAKGPPAAIVILAAGRRRYAPEFGGESVDALSLERTRYGADLARRTGLP